MSPRNSDEANSISESRRDTDKSHHRWRCPRRPAMTTANIERLASSIREERNGMSYSIEKATNGRGESRMPKARRTVKRSDVASVGRCRGRWPRRLGKKTENPVIGPSRTAIDVKGDECQAGHGAAHRRSCRDAGAAHHEISSEWCKPRRQAPTRSRLEMRQEVVAFQQTRRSGDKSQDVQLRAQG